MVFFFSFSCLSLLTMFLRKNKTFNFEAGLKSGKVPCILKDYIAACIVTLFCAE